MPDVIHDDPDLSSLLAGDAGLDHAAAARRPRSGFRRAAAQGAISASRPSMPSAPSAAAEITAAGSALFYVEKTQIDSRPSLNPPARDTSGAALAIDAATRANLELTRTLSGERAGSLLATIDCTVTPGGARLLAERLAGPLTHPDRIRDRQDSVACARREQRPARPAAAHPQALARSGARPLPPRPRTRRPARSRLRARRPVRRARARARTRHRARSAAGTARRPRDACRRLRTDVADRLAAALADELPLLKRDGGFVRAGFDPNLDELRELQQDSRRFIAALQSALRDGDRLPDACASSTTT